MSLLLRKWVGETLALTPPSRAEANPVIFSRIATAGEGPALSPQEGGKHAQFPEFSRLWCGLASWGLTSAATVQGFNARNFLWPLTFTPNRTLSQHARRLREPMRHFDSARYRSR